MKDTILKYISIALLFLSIVFLVTAIPFTPQGDIELKNNYALLNATNVTSTRATIGGINLNSSGIFVNSSQKVSGNVSWTDLSDYPVACPANTYVTQIDDSITCTAITTIPNNVAMSKNVTVAENNTICLNDACTRYITSNGTATIIQG